MPKRPMQKASNSSTTTSRVKIIGEGLDEWGDRYFKFTVKSSGQDIPPFSVKQLLNEQKELFTALANAGWNAFTATTQRTFLQKLEAHKKESPSFKVVTRLGWNSGAFVFPDKVVGKPTMRVERAFDGLDVAMRTKYRVRGSLEEWQDNIARLCVGNSRLMFAVSLAFTGPILPFVSGQKSGGFQLWGEGESGKTSAAIVAGSVWGCHRGEARRENGFGESWKSTAGKVEVTALAHNDGLLILDETKLVANENKQRARIVTEVVFNLAEHTEKERLTNVTSARAWRCYFLSTSNLSFEQLCQEGDVHVGKAEVGRMSDIPMPANGHGLYEVLHGFGDGGKLSDYLQRWCRRLYGSPIRAFVRRLVKAQRGDRKSLKRFLAKERKVYLRAVKRIVGKDLQPLNRVSGRFATVFAAGCLAITYGVLPWKRKKLLNAVLSCQLDQHRRGNAVDDSTNVGETSLRAKLVQYLSDNHAKFVDLQQGRLRFGRDNIEAAAGYIDHFNGKAWYCLTSKTLTKIIGHDKPARTLKQQLVSEGLMEQKKNKQTVQRRIFDGGKGNKNFAWVHAFSTAICDEVTQQ